ncbi:MAG: SMC family ATPase [Chloroflexi bacterium]|nr:MAG: SMC family ATPase [Chloroflexota bacterium]MBL1195636.1 SMC family ATPase [Chloroflexota bacterium]NOH12924.1 SMC family ATPase [Chloroflexota bacterium]
MIPLHLSISGFLSYRDPVELDFTQFELACISGANGAGKSSLLDAITWAMFGQARARGDAIINSQSTTAEVSFTFEYESNTYRVMRTNPRDKTTELEFQVKTTEGQWKPLTERTLRGTEKSLNEMLRLDYETFVNAAFFLQGKADQFTQQTPANRKRILSSILGLEVWETYRLAAAERRKVVEEDITQLDGRLQEINAELAEEETRKARLKELEGELERLAKARTVQETALEEMRRRAASIAEQAKLVNTLAGQLERAQKQLTESQTKLEERQAEKDKYNDVMTRAKEIEAAHKDWLAARDELAQWEKDAAKFHEQEAQRQEPRSHIEAAKARLEAELENLHKEQSSVETSKEQVKDLESQLVDIQKELQTVEAKQAELEGIEGQLVEARQKQDIAQGENPFLKQEMDDLKARIDQLQSTNGAVCPLCGQPLDAEERKALIERLNAEGTKKGDKFRANKTTLDEAHKHVNELEVALKAFAPVEEQLRQQTRNSDQLKVKLEQIKTAEAEWKKEGAKRLKEIETALKKSDYAPEAHAALKAIDAELKKIGYDTAAHDAVRQREEEGRASEAELRTLENARAALAPLEREISDLEKQITGQQKEIDTQTKTHDEATASLAASQAEAPDVDQAQRDMLALKEQENIHNQEVGAARQKVEILETQRQRKAELEGERETKAQKVGQFKGVERAFGKDGVPAMLIEQALPQIEINANEILGRLTNDTMNLSFVTQRAFKDAKREDMKETLDIQISDAAGVRDYEMFSGGEAFRINFAIRLALSEVLAQRAGARLQTLVIDEGFGSQDEAGRQRLIEAINTVKDDFAKILVITHIDSLKDVFPHRIEVEKGQRGSVVSVV